MDKYEVNLLSTAYEDCIYITKLSEEGSMRSTSAETKNFADNVSTMYKNAMNEIEEAAGKMNIELPLDMRGEQLAKWKEMVKETGWNFDKKFVDLIMDASYKTKTLLSNIQASTKSNDVQIAAKNILAFTSNQKDMAEQVKQLINEQTKENIVLQTSTAINE